MSLDQSKILAALDKESLPETEIDLAFFDIDGTVVSGADLISEPTREGILALQAKGIPAGLATGRPYFGCLDIIRQLEIASPSVFFSGSLIIRPGETSPVFECPLTPDEFLKGVNLARQHKIYCEAYTANNYFVEETSYLAEVHATYLKKAPIFRPFRELIAHEKVLKLVMIVHDGPEVLTLHRIRKELPLLSFGLSHGAAHPEIIFANITSPRASRKRAFEVVSEHLKVEPRHVMAFGDAESDIPFLTLAGMGIAMGNASASVKQAARYVTEPVTADGVAFALDRLNIKPGPRSRQRI